MKNQDFEIGIKTIWLVIIGNILFAIAGTFAKIEHWEYSELLLSISLILFLSTIVIIVRDIDKNKVKDKPFWIMSMFILPTISPILYITRRNKMIKLRRKFGR
jgi:hypothetical protein